ncbi:DUF2919 family protein [Edwardsiella tarda]|uniref:DUF2919 family protein n=1 Tax=Edwardsiella tarda TaxID=636 RepID=UPI003C6FE93B
MNKKYNHKDYGENGLLILPYSFWFSIAIQIKSWIIFFFAIMSGVTLNDFIIYYYQSESYFLYDLLLGIPAIFFIIIYPLRDKLPLVARGNYIIMFCSIIISIIYIIFSMKSIEENFWLFLLCLNIISFTLAFPSKRIVDSILN